MTGLKTINLELHWSEIEAKGLEDELTIGGITPGGKSIKVVVKLGRRDSLGYLGANLHEALKKREAELQQVRGQLEGKV